MSLETGPSIPVVCYHSIAEGERTDVGTFEAHLQVLSRSGLPSLRTSELDAARKGVLVTFDDGFHDLWTHGLPLLRTYGVRAVVFMIASVAGDGEPRPQGQRAFPGNSAEALAENARSPGPHPGFLHWSELRALEASGLVEVQSHTLGHRVVWAGDSIRGFHLGPRGRAHWSLPQATDGDERLGIPLYRRLSAIAHRRYFDDRGLRDALAGWMDARGGQEYVTAMGIEPLEAELGAVARDYRASHPDGGRWETEAERVERTVGELGGAREILEERLGGTRDELCLPWGHWDPVTFECARKVGIRRFYTTGRGANPAGRLGSVIQRFGPMRKSNGAAWLRWRLWIYRSCARAALYGATYGVKPRALLKGLWR